MLRGPCLKLRDINRIGQSPRRLIGKFRPPGVTQHVDDEWPAVLFRPHGYHQPLSRPDVALAQLSGQWRPLRRRRFARTTLNLSLIGHRSSVRHHMYGPDMNQAPRRGAGFTRWMNPTLVCYYRHRSGRAQG